MTDLQREQIVRRMFPDWREHLNDGRVIDQILEGLTCDRIIFNRCSRPSCKNVARPGLKTCTRCAAKTAQYMRLYKRRKKPAQQCSPAEGQERLEEYSTPKIQIT
jgi:hypothetical protein